jgi:hypothetical protein
VESQPLDVIPIGEDGIASWNPPAEWFRSPVYELAYVLRAYGTDGNFDETRPQPLWLVYDAIDKADDDAIALDADPELYAAYGENSLNLHNIALSSGTVSVRGSGIAPQQEVWVAGRRVPVDAGGNFVTEEILPGGQHTVEVAVLDPQGAGELYLRDLEFENNDWFYVGMADLTVSEGEFSGPVDLLQGDNPVNPVDSTLDGRLAFFVNGKFADHWKVTASADTREGPLEDLFSNFMDKSPESLFRRIDPDYYYPTFGDDSTVEEMAPTMGKFFVRLAHGDNFGQWGNFKVGYMNNELAQVDRGLYGANLHYQSGATTSFGDQRYAVDVYAAEPGTIASREEFRGTGGSLYFLQRQDVLAGSERVRVELRDKASGIVTGVLNLTPVLDYDIDYLQGRIVLTEPLASTADDNLLVRSNALSGDEAYLVVRYEYTPGFDEVDALSVGGQAHAWVGDYVKLGVTTNNNEENAADSSLNAADLTLRLAAHSRRGGCHACRPQRQRRGPAGVRPRPADVVRAGRRGRLLGAGPDRTHRHQERRWHLHDADRRQVLRRRQGRQPGAGAGPRDRCRGSEPGLPGQRQLGTQRRLPRRQSLRQRTGGGADAGDRRARRRRAAGRLRLQDNLERLRLLPGYRVRLRQPPAERACRPRRLLPRQRTPAHRRRSVER